MKRRIIFLGSLILILLNACGQNNSKIVQTLNEKATHLLVSNPNDLELDTAIRLLDSAINYDSLYRWSYVNMVTALCKQGQCSQAINCLNKLIVLEPDDPNHYMFSAMILDNLGKKDSANLRYRQSRKLFDSLMVKYPDKINYRIESIILDMLFFGHNYGLQRYRELKNLYPTDENLIAMEDFFLSFSKNEYFGQICGCD